MATPSIATEAQSDTKARHPAVSVIIATRNRATMLAEAVSAVCEQDLDDEIELIVTDDASTDDTEQVMRDLLADARIPITYLRLRDHSGPARGRNAGLGVARGRFIAFTDDDCVPSREWLRAALDAFHSPNVGMVQGQTVPIRPPGKLFTRHVETRSLDGTFAAANMVYRREALAEGGFDPTCQQWWEDMDLGWRVKEDGWDAVFAPEALVRHQILHISAVDWILWPHRYSLWCANTARHPGFRKHLFLGVWVRPMHLYLDVAVAGFIAFKWWRPAILLALPYGIAFARTHRVKGVRSFARLFPLFIRDCVALLSLVAGSLRYRAVVL